MSGTSKQYFYPYSDPYADSLFSKITESILLVEPQVYQVLP